MGHIHWIMWELEPEIQFSSVQSHSVVSHSLRPHELQHARPPCPSPTPGVHSDWHPSSQWCHPAISSSVVPFSSCPQSLPESESFPMSQLFAWGGQRIGVSALASFLPKKSQGWSPSEWTGWISCSQGTLKGLFQHHGSEAPIFGLSHLCVILAAMYLCLSVFVHMVKQNWSKKSYFVWFRVSNREADAYLCRVIHG